MKAVEVKPILPQDSAENTDTKKVPTPEQPVLKDELAGKEPQRIRNISAFCDCV